MKTNFAINIGRQLGSGGRDIGEQLAKCLDIPFYDKELITIASQESGLAKDIFEKADEKTGFSFTSGLFGLRSTFIGDEYIDNYLGNESLFRIQSDVIRNLNKKNNCVFVGRCADYILRDNPNAINIFICADIEERIKRVSERNKLSDKKAQDLIEKTDKGRASYYNYYSNKEWGKADSYHLCFNSSIGVVNSVKLIEEFVRVKLGDEYDGVLKCKHK